MKLRSKIFLCLLALSLITLLSSTYYLINRNHLNNISMEQERSLNDLEFIRSSLENNMILNDSTTSNLQLLFSHYADYYANRGVYLLLYHNDKPIYNKLSDLRQSRYSKLLLVEPGTKQVQIIKEADQYYILVAARLSTDQTILVYARNISKVYQIRTQNINLSLIFAVCILAFLCFLSYLISHSITKPIMLLNQGAAAIANGDYSVRIATTKDEFNELGNAFNQMSSAVEIRTKELKEKAKELEIFIDDLSHEMNTPLTSIQGYSEFIINAKASREQQQKAAKIILSEAKRMGDIYSKLLSFSIIREQSPAFRYVKLGVLFAELKDSFLPQLKEQDITLTLHNTLDNILADQTLLHMLLSNLIKNSLQAMASGGAITLCAYQEEDSKIIEVIDNGSGIPEDKIKDILKPFFRVDKSRSRKTGGAGLGLSICKRIADLHYAKIEITSSLAKGTKVKIIFYNSDTTS